MRTKRIWELDAFRGICILAMVVIHFVYDLVELYGVISWEYPPLFTLIKQWGGVLFLLLSGVCVTLGHHSVRRGLIVFGCGMVCTAVTAGMYLLHLADSSILILFGVLHCLGVCMLLWPLLKKIPRPAAIALSAVLIGAGLGLQYVRVSFDWLFPLGLISADFVSSDYFPLLPHLGFFLAGSLLGTRFYAGHTSLLPRVDETNPVLRFLCFCGRQSLLIYLLHQPVLSLICMLML